MNKKILKKTLKKILKKIFPKKIFDLLHNFYYNSVFRIINQYDHIYDPSFNSTFTDIHFTKNITFDLQNELTINKNNYHKNTLITYILRADNFLKNKNYIFEAWVKNNNYTYSDNEIFVKSHRKKILASFTKKEIKIYNKKVFLLPYYSNQAGHFIGENLGSILFFLEFLKKRKKKEKLLIITPSKKWDNFFKKFYKDNLLFFNNDLYLKKNIIFTKSQIFPKFSIFQNYIISKNILANKIENNIYLNKKVFLTSERSERILNIKNLISYLKKKNFIILNPKNMDLLKMLKLLNSAKCVISESASIAHNIHIARHKPYYLLLSNEDKIINKEWDRLTTAYSNFHSGLFYPIYCKKTSFEHTVESYNILNGKLNWKIKFKEDTSKNNKNYTRPLLNQIKVDLKKLRLL